MKQKYTYFLLSKICILLMVLLSCKKVESNVNFQDISKLVSQIPTWLENQKKENYLRGPLGNIDALVKTIDLSQAFLIKRDSSIDYLVVPIKDDFLKLKKFDLNSTMNLIFFVERSNEITDAFLTQYLPQDGKKILQLPKSTYIDIMYRNPLQYKGRYRFFDISCVLDFQVTYDGEKFTSATLKSGNQKNKTAGGDTNAIKNKVSYISECIDWYLVTTYILSDGTVVEDWDYFTTTCPSGDCTDITGQPVPCSGGNGSPDENGNYDPDVIEEYSIETEKTTPDPYDTQDNPGYGSTFGPITYKYHIRLRVSQRLHHVIEVSEAWVYLDDYRKDITDTYGRPAYRKIQLFNDTSRGFPSPGSPRYAEVRFKCDVFTRWIWPSVPWESSDQWTHTDNQIVKSY